MRNHRLSETSVKSLIVRPSGGSLYFRLIKNFRLKAELRTSSFATVSLCRWELSETVTTLLVPQRDHRVDSRRPPCW
jgi:hypothetical protein